MSKLLIGILVGAALGAIDGALSGVEDKILLGVVFGSTFKGVLGGVAAGLVAMKTPKHVPIMLGALLVAAAFSQFVAMTATLDGEPDGPKANYWRIMLPGLAVGLITGYAVIRYGRPSRAASSA